MSTYDKYYEKFEDGFFANSTVGVLVQSCVGGVAAMAVLQNGTSFAQMLQLFLVVSCSIGYNGAILSQQKPKIIFNMLLLSVGLNLLIATLNFAS